MEADEDLIIKAAKLVGRVLEQNNIPHLEGIVALKSIVKTLEKQAGYEIGIEEIKV